MERYREIARCYVDPHLGSLTLMRLPPAHVAEWCAALLARGGAGERPLSARSVRDAFALLKSALSWAVRMQLAATNPALVVRPPHAVRSDAAAFPPRKSIVSLLWLMKRGGYRCCSSHWRRARVATKLPPYGGKV